MTRCSDCGTTWTGQGIAHCAAQCHRTFSAVSTFDKHRRNGRCLDPAEVGLAPNAHGVYRTPSEPDVTQPLALF